MASNMQDPNQVTVVLGDEFDGSLQEKLMNVLRQLGAIPFKPAERYVVGSQDLQIFEVILNGQPLRIESETYIGLSISGSDDLVQQVRRLVLSQPAQQPEQP